MATDMFMIYQINDAEKNREYRCRSYAYQIEHGFMITTDNYEISYCGKASQGLVPAKIRENMESLNSATGDETGRTQEDLEANAFAGLLLMPDQLLHEQILLYGLDKDLVTVDSVLMLK